MQKTALFVRHTAKPGKRDKVRDIWEKYVKPRVQSNPAHEAYYFCYDDLDPDTICVFQLFSSKEAVDAFISGDWYQQYLDEVSAFILKAPKINTAHPQWIKEVSD